MTDRPRVAVVFGGRSTEHEISCLSARSVLAAIDRGRYEVVPVGITRDGGWVALPADHPLAVKAGRLPRVEPGDGAPVVLPPDPTALEVAGSLGGIDLGRFDLGRIDVVFPLLHGPYGEDGTIQGLLELAGVPYVGAGVLSSALAMDKHHMKNALTAAGLPGPAHVAVSDRAWRCDPAAVRQAVAGLGWPVFVKPARGGSSVGISKVTGPAGLDAAIETARAADPKVVVEAAAAGRELECGVLEGPGGGPPEASLPAEVRVALDRDFYDFEAKYLDHDTEFDVPAKLPDEVTARVRTMAVRAFEALDCEGLARVDFFWSDDGERGSQLLVNEVNTMPGFTPSSMFPRMWEATGLQYEALIDRLLTTALARRPVLR